MSCFPGDVFSANSAIISLVMIIVVNNCQVIVNLQILKADVWLVLLGSSFKMGYAIEILLIVKLIFPILENVRAVFHNIISRIIYVIDSLKTALISTPIPIDAYNVRLDSNCKLQEFA